MSLGVFSMIVSLLYYVCIKKETSEEVSGKLCEQISHEVFDCYTSVVTVRVGG